MPSRMQTLSDYLRTPDPAINIEKCCKGTNTTQTRYDTPRQILEWRDFNFETLSSTYGGKLYEVLNRSFDFNNYSNIREYPFRGIQDEDSFQRFLVLWNWQMVSEALTKSQPHLLPLRHHVYMSTGGQARCPKPKKGERAGAQKRESRNDKERRWKPDWGCYTLDSTNDEDSEDPINEPSLLPGDSKISTKWSSSQIHLGKVELRWGTKSQLSPLRQIYSYCLAHNRRYGYLITDLELVAIRIRFQNDNDAEGDMITPDPDTLRARARKSSVLEYKAIPWQSQPLNANQTAGGLTMNMGLWWLHIMATGNTNIGFDYGDLDAAVWAPVNRTKASTPSRPGLIKVCIEPLAF